MATPSASCGSRDVRYGIARAAGVEDFQMLLRRHLQPLQRLAEARAKQPEPRRVEAVVLADDFVLLEVDQILVKLIVAVQRRDADLPVFRRLCHRFQRLLDLGGDCGNLVSAGARDEMLHRIGLEQQSVVVAVVDRLRAAFDDLDAALGIDVDQAFGFKLADRLAHGVERRAQKIGEFAL